MKNVVKKMTKDERGVAALMVVVIILSLVLSLGLAVAKSSVNELSLSLESDQAHKVIQIGNSCVDEAQFRLKRSSSYTGGTITFADGSCTVAIAGGGLTRTVTIEATAGNLTRDFTVDAALLANIAATAEGAGITNWEEN